MKASLESMSELNTMQEEINEEIDENEDIIHLWEPLDFDIDKEYDYVPSGKLFQLVSYILYYGIAYPVLYLFTKIVYDLKIEGKENIQNWNSGAISVSNHVLYLDCAMIGLAYRFHKIYYTTREGSFKIPLVRKLIRLLRAIPIPHTIENQKYFMEAVEGLLQNGNILHIYPEAALWTYCNRLRKFKNGAFHLAVKYNVPIIPTVITFRDPSSIRKMIKKKKDVTIKILKPIMPDQTGTNKEKEERLKQEVYTSMSKAIC